MVKIITDSSCMMNIKEAGEYGITVLPLQVTVQNVTYNDLENLTSKELLEQIAQKHYPTSSQPAVGLMQQVMEEAGELLYITMADGLSGTYQSAVSVCNMLENKEYVHVWNSRTLCGPQKYLVIKAAELAKEGKSVDEILKALEDSIEYSGSFLMPSDFDFLKRGGRMTPLAAAMGGLLKINPIVMQTKDGKRLDKFHLARTFGKGIDKILDSFKSHGVDENYKIYISHANVPEKCDIVLEKVKSSFPNTEYEIIELSPAMITQGGPGCVALQYIRK